MKPVLAVFSLADLNSPSSFGSIADKLDAYFTDGEVLGITFHKILLPGESSCFTRSSYSFVKFPKVMRFWFYSLQSFVWSKIGFTNRRSNSLLRKSRSLRASWTIVLNRFLPRAVIGIGLPQELLELAEEFGIPTIEVQHGSLSEETFRRYWPQVRPDWLFCWNSQTMEKAEELGFQAMKVGHPINQSLALTAEESSHKEICAGRRTGERYFLVALSWGVKNSVDPVGALHLKVKDALVEIMRNGYTPIFRIHPVVSSKVYASRSLRNWIKNEWPGSIVHDPRETSFLKSLVFSDFLLAFESAAAFEFSLANKPSILLDAGALSLAKTSALGGSDSNAPLIFGSYMDFLEYRPKVLRSAVENFYGAERLLQILES